jgi:hypothetical protein
MSEMTDKQREALARELGFEDFAALCDCASQQLEEIKELENAFGSDVAGAVPCQNCQHDAKWLRTDEVWSIECGICGWSATGKIKTRAH